MVTPESVPAPPCARHAVLHLVEDGRHLRVGDLGRDLAAAVDRAGVHDDGPGLGQFQVLQPQAEELEVLAGREGGFVLPLQLDAQHHDDVGVADRLPYVVGEPDARRNVRQLRRQQRGGAAQHDIHPELREQVDVGARHAAVGDVADDGHPQPFERWAGIQDGAGVQQRLRGMLVGAVARVDDRDGQVAGQKMGRARGCVAHDDRQDAWRQGCSACPKDSPLLTLEPRP
jgi:hypothetical protein